MATIISLDSITGQVNRDALWARIDRSGNCWLWKGNIQTGGRGQIKIKGRGVLVHRLIYALEVGPIPPDMYVCHHCDNKRCVRPEHLFLGTQADNMQDMMAKGRQNFSGLVNPKHHAASNRHLSPCGELNRKARLTWPQVREIRMRHAKGESQALLCRNFNLQHSAMSNLISGKHWREVEADQCL